MNARTNAPGNHVVPNGEPYPCVFMGPNQPNPDGCPGSGGFVDW